MNTLTNDPKTLVENSIGFLKRMGMKVLVMAPNHVEVMAPIAGNENHLGTIYAGALFSIAEVPGGVLFYTTFDANRFYPIVKDVRIRFLKPVTTDVTVAMSMTPAEARRITLEAEEKGKADFQMETEVKNTQGEVVAATTSLYQIRRINHGKDSDGQA
ncbi:MAG: YiiD C-terminal domain-containing protein [Desulfobacterium sp.]|nr:YiiD C-terminal domain-containing protein [Desulfobacterium sp.]